jgi:pre-mRNA-splicing factor ATP-dependent RNA helicase DHX38/PRP16
MREVDTDFDHDSDVRVMLLVHDTKPPFLDGRFLFTKQRGEWSVG